MYADDQYQRFCLDKEKKKATGKANKAALHCWRHLGANTDLHACILSFSAVVSFLLLCGWDVWSLSSSFFFEGKDFFVCGLVWGDTQKDAQSVFSFFFSGRSSVSFFWGDGASA
nr:hypothetical protein [Pandoravirus aubagnensis]